MEERLANLHQLIANHHGNVCSITVMKDGKKVYEDSFNDYKKEDYLQVMSVTKSVVSLLIGIAIDQGLIKDTNQAVLDFFPDYQIKRGEKTIQQITLKHLLTMTAPYKYKHEPWTNVCTSNDWTKAALDLLGGRSGITGEFKYATLGIQILMGVIANVSKMKTIDFANKYLFLPLGIAKHFDKKDTTVEEQIDFFICKKPKGPLWYADPVGINTAGWGLCLTSEEMAKIGQMCLNKGIYNNKQIITYNYIKEMTTPYYYCDDRFANMAYGYLWWIIDQEKGIFAAIGDGGNIIYINPSSNIVVAINATFKPRIFDRVDFIQAYIEPLF